MSDWTEHQHHVEPSKDCHLCAQRSETGTRSTDEDPLAIAEREAEGCVPCPMCQTLIHHDKLHAPSETPAWREIWDAAIEKAAQVVDECNREGPYNAIGAASRIRELTRQAGSDTPAPREADAIPLAKATAERWLDRYMKEREVLEADNLAWLFMEGWRAGKASDQTPQASSDLQFEVKSTRMMSHFEVTVTPVVSPFLRPEQIAEAEETQRQVIVKALRAAQTTPPPSEGRK